MRGRIRGWIVDAVSLLLSIFICVAIAVMMAGAF